MTLLSIIIPNYNYGHFADRFFGSIAAQTLRLDDVEILFVDDGSSDNSIEQAQKWAGKINCACFEILTPPRSGKPGLVRNHGLERAKGQYLVCFDPDDSLHPAYLSTCIDFLELNPEISLVYTDYLERKPDTVTEFILPDFKPLYLRTQNPIPPAAVFRREIWDAGVRYKDNTTYEDWDFWIQCIMAGAKASRIAKVLYTYEIHDSNFSHQAVKDDGPAKACIVLNNPAFFQPVIRRWAQDHLRGRAYAPAFRRGYIPTANDIKKLMDVIKRVDG
ncbi:glycosyltransferase family 2 protein [Maridesulfovibrio hydrothermalis]|uniref:Glycosyl transferase family 2 n=1 Tax=Maridesulfovibrio hydrothermalis AM13 = DSM 14728 TaxID=1121451 RepID=L0RGV1_9BACT|nr:glycosyltransferase [Maridesulfovibrio hydrothermalis]CCO25462.1 Glycosyl transferase family 2 [Maridesulfovibrio hydrothermalis AM13 = DSM 14728]